MSPFAEQQLLQDLVDIEERVVAQWRFEQFRALGFGEEEALFLSASEVDLQLACKLVAFGCPLALALEILL